MANSVVQATAGGVALKDARLFREACYIDGAWLTSANGATTNVDNPATGEILGTVPKLGVAETRAAIEAADQAFPAWSKKTEKEHAAVLRRWFDLMIENHGDLARFITLEHRYPLTQSHSHL